MPNGKETQLANLRPFSKENQPKHTGRMSGVRNKLSKQFITALAKDFEEHGEQSISELRENDPGKYLTLIAGLLPKDATITVRQSPFDEVSTEQLATLVAGFGLLSGGGEILDAEGVVEQVLEGEFSPVH